MTEAELLEHVGVCVKRVVAVLAVWRGVPYSWGGGHPFLAAVAGKGSPGRAGGVGVDCSGFVGAVLAREGFAVPRDGTATTLWEYMGRPAGGFNAALPFDVVWWRSLSSATPCHVGFVVIPRGWHGSYPDGLYVSAFRGGSATNGDDPKAKVQLHSSKGTGLVECGSAAPSRLPVSARPPEEPASTGVRPGAQSVGTFDASGHKVTL